MHRYYRTVNATAATSVKAGGFAKHWNTFALGCALGLLTVEEVYQSYQNAEILRIDSGLTYNNVNQESYFQKISMNGLLSTVGVLFKPTSDISVGASLQHTLIMKEEITMDINTTKLLLDGKQEVVVNSDGHTSMQRGGDSRSSKVLIKRFPLALRLGAAVKPIPRLSLAGDLNYHFPVNLNSAEYNHVAVLNVHCGLDFLLLPQIHLRSGYFTNKDSRPRLVENKPNQLDHVDYQGTTLFGEYSMDKSRYGIGVIYQWGKGQGQKIQSSDGGPAPLQEIVGNRMAYTITISHMVGSS
jgi:hypothetical protein